MKRFFSSIKLKFVIFFLIIFVIPLTVILSRQQQDLRKDAAVTKTGFCRDLKPSETIPVTMRGQDSSYKWVPASQCSIPCKRNAECPRNYSDPYINPSESAWCYPFESSTTNAEGWRCLKLTYIGPR